MTEEDSWDPGSSSDYPEGFPQDTGSRQNVSPKKIKGSLGDSINYLSNTYAPAYYSMPMCSCKPDQDARTFQKVKPHHYRTRNFACELQEPYDAPGTSDMNTDEVLTFVPVPQQNMKPYHRTRSFAHELQESCDAAGTSDMNAGEVLTFIPVPQQNVKPHHHRTRSFAHKLQEPCDAPSTSDMNAGEVFTFAPVPQRKTYQPFGQENKAAATIQSAWRCHQARQNMDQMNKAATQIQANVRGYLTRKELPLGLCCYSWTEGGKRMGAQRKSHSFPVSLNSLPHSDLDSESPAERQQRTCSQSHKPRRSTKHVSDGYPCLNRRVCFDGASAIRPSHYPPFSVSATGIQEQRCQDAASTIQAAWRAYQSRQRRRPLIQVDRPPFHSNVTIKQASWRNAVLGCAFSQGEIQQIFANSNVLVLDKAPRVRNINIYTVVKGMPVTSPKPNISVEVKSPQVSIQGFQREMASGVQAVYTVRNPSVPRASQIHVHVNMKKGKALG